MAGSEHIELDMEHVCKKADQAQANVMLAYPIPEAKTLLSDKLDAARTGLEHCEEDLDFLREQITVCWQAECGQSLTWDREYTNSRLQTLEVATARVYNWDVGMRRKEKIEGKSDPE